MAYRFPGCSEPGHHPSVAEHNPVRADCVSSRTITPAAVTASGAVRGPPGSTPGRWQRRECDVEVQRGADTIEKTIGVTPTTTYRAWARLRRLRHGGRVKSAGQELGFASNERRSRPPTWGHPVGSASRGWTDTTATRSSMRPAERGGAARRPRVRGNLCGGDWRRRASAQSAATIFDRRCSKLGRATPDTRPGHAQQEILPRVSADLTTSQRTFTSSLSSSPTPEPRRNATVALHDHGAVDPRLPIASLSISNSC